MDWRCAKGACRLRTLVLMAVVVLGVSSGGCGDGARRQHAVDAALKAASAALVAGDAAAWYFALPTEGASAALVVRQVNVGLARYTWTRVHAKAVPVDGKPGRYTVRFYGQLAHADTSPLVCECVLDFGWRDGRLKVVADRTDQWARDAYYLAFTDPVVLVRPHLVVVGDDWQRPLMARIAAADGQVRRVIRRLQLAPDSPGLGRKTLIYVCASRLQAFEASHAFIDKHMVAGERDGQIFAVDVWPAYWKRYASDIVRHELTHVYAGKFGDGKHCVGLLVEGLAVAVEGGYDFGPLRTEVARGNRILPLKKGLMHGRVWWDGLSDHRTYLAYLEGGALVKYIWKRWGLKSVWAFAAAVSAGDATPVGIERATGRTLGITWGQFYKGWKGYVRTLR